MKYTKDDIQHILQALEDLNYEPNDWEETFIDNIRDNLSLTEKQTECLERIYSKAAGCGRFQGRQYFT